MHVDFVCLILNLFWVPCCNGQVMVYTAGFPCQPYSMLNNVRLMLQDANARQLWAVLRNIRQTKPMEPQLEILQHVQWPRYHCLIAAFPLHIHYISLVHTPRFACWRMSWAFVPYLIVWWPLYKETCQSSPAQGLDMLIKGHSNLEIDVPKPHAQSPTQVCHCNSDYGSVSRRHNLLCMSQLKNNLRFFHVVEGSSNFLVAPRKHFGAPISRRRLFIYLLRRDVMTADSLAEDFNTVLARKLTDLLLAFSKEKVPQWFLDPTMICFLLCATTCWQCQTLCFWIDSWMVATAICRTLTPRSDLLLPADHPAVVRDKNARVELRKRNAHKLLDFFRPQSNMHWVSPGHYLISK